MAMCMAERGKLPEAVSALVGVEDFMEDMLSKDDHQDAKECTDIHDMIHVACLGSASASCYQSLFQFRLVTMCGPVQYGSACLLH
eukprot:3434372-Lingulodinium_polyedra.AAC.1